VHWPAGFGPPASFFLSRYFRDVLARAIPAPSVSFLYLRIALNEQDLIEFAET
jgi:hypothetical protein